MKIIFPSNPDAPGTSNDNAPSALYPVMKSLFGGIKHGAQIAALFDAEFYRLHCMAEHSPAMQAGLDAVANMDDGNQHD